MSTSGRAERLRTIGTNIAFVDDNGVLWTVIECDARNLPGTRGLQCLIFQSSEAARRVWQYPVGWRELAIPGLIALSWCR